MKQPRWFWFVTNSSDAGGHYFPSVAPECEKQYNSILAEAIEAWLESSSALPLESL